MLSSISLEFQIVSIYRMLCGLCYYGNYYTCVNLVSTAFGRRSDCSDNFVSYWYAALMEIPIWILPFILQGRPRVCQVTLIVSLVCAAVLSICDAILPTGELKKGNLKGKYRWPTECTMLLKVPMECDFWTNLYITSHFLVQHFSQSMSYSTVQEIPCCYRFILVTTGPCSYQHYYY